MEARGRDWRTIMLAIGGAGGALLGLATVTILLVMAAVAWARGDTASGSSPLDIIVLLSALLVIGAVFVPAAYYSFQRLSGHAVPTAAPRRLGFWQGVVLVLGWIAAAFGAQALLQVPILKWITPALYVLAICIPVYFFARLATGGLVLGSRQRLWGVLAAGIGLGTTIAMTAEVLLALLGVIALAVYVGLHPENLQALRQLAGQLLTTGDPEQALNLLSPWINNPLAAAAALLFFSGFSPLIEETSKSIAVWTVFDRLTSRAQGFALGALSGAAFALVESLLVSANPESNWSTTLMVRGASTMMHIMAASLTGWGIASFRLTKKPGTLLGLYLLAMGLHGLWNASVIAIAFGSLRTALAPNRSDIAGMALMFIGGAVLLILCVLIPIGLAATNWQFRAMNAREAGTSSDSFVPGDAVKEVLWALEDRDEPDSTDAPPTSPPDPLT